MKPVVETARHGGVDYPIRGECDERFARVVERFVANFAGGEEAGAGVSVTHNGQPVVDGGRPVGRLRRPRMP
jgi:hypothetical protein